MPLDRPTLIKPTPEAEVLFRRWLGHIHEELCRHTSPDRRAEIVRDELFQIYLGRPHGGKVNGTLTSELAVGVLSETFDPRNASFAADGQPDLDQEQYAPRRPLIYFWHMFDHSPLALNGWLGPRFRCMLGRHIFQHVGKNVTIMEGVEFARGYNLTLEDGCTVERNVYLDDVRGMVVHANTTVSADTRGGTRS